MYIEKKYAYEKDGIEHEYHVVADENPMNPRKEYDNVGTMVCFHNRYKLGDEGHGYNSENFNGWGSVEEAIREQEKPLIILPLYLMDHSGLSISTRNFNNPWDSGQVGFIFISIEKAKMEWPDLKDEGLYNQACKCLEGEVETHDHYLRGNVHGFVIYKVTTCDQGCEHREYIDSCWGFYGDIEDSGVLYPLPEGAVEIE